MIASLSIPWGDEQSDDATGGYHLVWTRDLVKSVGALLAVGDLNNDGWPDVVIANSGEPPLVLQNTAAGQNHWIGLAGLSTGTTITWSAGGREWSRLKIAGGSYLSAHDPRELLSLGPAEVADAIEIRKPDGIRLKFTRVVTGRYYTVSIDGKLQ